MSRHLPLLIAIFSSVPENYSSDAAPFSIAQSRRDGDNISYTITGPKQETTYAAVFAAIGIFWVFMILVFQFTSVTSTPSASPSYLPIWLSVVFLVVGVLSCRQAYIRQYAASRKYQIAINTLTKTATFSSTKSAQVFEHDTPLIQISKTDDGKFHTVSIVAGEHAILLGLLRKHESAELYTSLLKEETGLPIFDATGFSSNPVVYHASLTRLDEGALKKPVQTKPI